MGYRPDCNCWLDAHEVAPYWFSEREYYEQNQPIEQSDIDKRREYRFGHRFGFLRELWQWFWPICHYCGKPAKVIADKECV